MIPSQKLPNESQGVPLASRRPRRIDGSRSLPDYELRVLADPESQSTFHLRELDDLAENDDALVALNGYYWEGDEGFVCGPGPLSCEGTPKTSVFLNGERRTSLSSEFFSETFLGFGRGGPRGIPIQHMDGTEIDDPGPINSRRNRSHSLQRVGA